MAIVPSLLLGTAIWMATVRLRVMLKPLVFLIMAILWSTQTSTAVTLALLMRTLGTSTLETVKKKMGTRVH